MTRNDNKRRIIILTGWIFCVIADRYLGLNAMPPLMPAPTLCFLPLIAAGIAAAASIASTAAANKRLRKADEKIQSKQDRLDNWYKSEMATNALDRADAQAALRKVRENMREAMKSAETDSIKRGMTDEAKVAQAARLNRGYADVVSQIAASGQQHKDRVQQQYMSAMNGIDDMRISNLMDTSGAQAMGNAISSAGGALATGLSGAGGANVKVPSIASQAQAGLQHVKNDAASYKGFPSWGRDMSYLKIGL